MLMLEMTRETACLVTTLHILRVLVAHMQRSDERSLGR